MLSDGVRRYVLRSGARSASKIAVDVVEVAALGFELNSHVFDSQSVEALRHELLRRKRRHATELVHRLRKRSATLSGKEIVEAVRRDRARTDR